MNIFNTLLSTETYNKPAVKLFPNPVNNQFVVENLLNKTVTITDIAGKVVQVLINYAGETISTMDFNQGIYFVSFIEDNLNTTLKLIVRK